VAGSSGHDNKFSGAIKGGEFFEQLSNYLLTQEEVHYMELVKFSLFICGLFNDAVSSSDNIASNDGMVDE
jgi:hypothetical protein